MIQLIQQDQLFNGRDVSVCEVVTLYLFVIISKKCLLLGLFSRLFPGILHDPVPGCFAVLLCIFKPCWSKCAFLNHMSMIVNDHNQDQNQMCSNLYL